MAEIFSDTIQNIQDSVDLKIYMSNLEKLLIQEMKTQWDLSTLRNYIEQEMIPRDLRIHKIPTTMYNKQFTRDWE